MRTPPARENEPHAKAVKRNTKAGDQPPSVGIGTEPDRQVNVVMKTTTLWVVQENNININKHYAL